MLLAGNLAFARHRQIPIRLCREAEAPTTTQQPSTSIETQKTGCSLAAYYSGLFVFRPIHTRETDFLEQATLGFMNINFPVVRSFRQFSSRLSLHGQN